MNTTSELSTSAIRLPCYGDRIHMPIDESVYMEIGSVPSQQPQCLKDTGILVVKDQYGERTFIEEDGDLWRVVNPWYLEYDEDELESLGL